VRRIVLSVAAGIVVVALPVGLWAFEPWRLFTSSTIDEALPTSAPVASPGTPSPEQTASPPADTLLSVGEFVDAEHATSGTARILELADGRRYLRIENLSSSDGPDLHMWLSDAKSGGDWDSYDDGDFVKLGELKATHGNQNYRIPDDADLSTMRSVVIWCDRFNVAFGSAPIRIS
jgi:hypothetical protein